MKLDDGARASVMDTEPDDDPLGGILANSRHAARAPSWTLAEMLLASENLAHTERFLRAHRGDPAVPELLRLLEHHRTGGETVAQLARAHTRVLESAHGDASLIDRVARFFDASVARCEEASVALYSLGSAEILAAATDEVVDAFARWSDLGPDRDVLQIGCGIGRIEAAMAPRVREAVGVDVSAGMIAAARRRCAGIPNARFEHTDGRDLGLFARGRFDLVFAVDTFPYLVAAGEDVVARHFAEARRVLRPGGAFVILNYSYRGDTGHDRDDVDRLSRAHGLHVMQVDEGPPSIWSGRIHRMT